MSGHVNEASPATFLHQFSEKTLFLSDDRVESQIGLEKSETVGPAHQFWGGCVQLKKISEQFFLVDVLSHRNILKIEKLKIPGFPSL